eukprot:jgi/Tetstr1/421762/TSEL_012666.t1
MAVAGWRIDHRVLTLPPGAEPPEWKLLQWAVEQGCALVGDSQVLRATAMGSRLEVLHWGAQSRGWPLQHISEWAAEAGQLAALQWAREQDCPWNERICMAAAKGGHLEVLQ